MVGLFGCGIAGRRKDIVSYQENELLEIKELIEAGRDVDIFLCAHRIGVSHDEMAKFCAEIKRAHCSPEKRLKDCMAWRDAQRQKNQPWYLRNPK